MTSDHRYVADPAAQLAVRSLALVLCVSLGVVEPALLGDVSRQSDCCPR